MGLYDYFLAAIRLAGAINEDVRERPTFTTLSSKVSEVLRDQNFRTTFEALYGVDPCQALKQDDHLLQCKILLVWADVELGIKPVPYHIEQEDVERIGCLEELQNTFYDVKWGAPTTKGGSNTTKKAVLDFLKEVKSNDVWTDALYEIRSNPFVFRTASIAVRENDSKQAYKMYVCLKARLGHGRDEVTPYRVFYKLPAGKKMQRLFQAYVRLEPPEY